MYEFKHLFQIVNKKLMQDIHYLYSIFNLEKIYGEDIEIQKIENKYLDLTLMLDWINSGWPNKSFTTLFDPVIQSDNARRKYFYNNI